MIDDQDRQLVASLEDAAQWCRPRHPDWQTLLERLGPQETIEAAADDRPTRAGRQSSRLRPRRLLTLAVGLLLTAGLIGLFSLIGRQGEERQAAAADMEIVVQRRGVEVTVFSDSDNEDPTLFMPLVGWPAQQNPSQQAEPAPPPSGAALRGMGLVKDRRMVLHLKQGDNIVEFTNVAAAIDPTSVRLTSETDPTGIEVVEQNFEFDLASADALLKRSLERRIACVGKDGQAGVEGFLLSYDTDTLVLADRLPEADRKAPRPKTQSVARRALKAIRLDDVPQDLYTRPTLVWKLRAREAGDHLTTLSYLCGNMTWQADYVVTILRSDPEGGDTLDMAGWVTIDNRSGATYEQAGLKLIAGDVNRVRDPWAPEPREYLFYVGFARGQAQGQSSSSLRKELIAKELFEYKLYALNLPSTIRESEIKQLGLLQASGIKARRRFVFDAHTVDRNGFPFSVSSRSGRLATELVVKNEKANKLGRPLPKGRVTFVATDADGESQFLGRAEIDHTPKDETLELKLGEAFDVTGESALLRSEVPHARRMIQTHEIRVRNHKERVIDVRAIGRLLGHANWQVTQSSDDYMKHDFQTVYFDFCMEPNSEKVITYTVDYQW
jgi:hypothetical protein